MKPIYIEMKAFGSYRDEKIDFTGKSQGLFLITEIENAQLSPLEAFREFYLMMNDQPMSEEEELELQQIIAKCDGSKEG